GAAAAAPPPPPRRPPTPPAGPPRRRAWRPAPRAAAPVAAISGAGWIARVGPALRRSLRVHAPFIALIAVYAAAAVILPPLFGVKARFAPGLYSDVLLTINAAFFLGLLFAYVTYVLVRVRPARLTHYLWPEING